MNKNVIAVLFAAVLGAIAPLNANAGGAVAGATEPTQILNQIQLVMSYVEQAQQTATQLQQYQTMLTNLMHLTPSNLLGQASQQLWQDQGMSQAFSNLRKIVVNGQNISYLSLIHISEPTRRTPISYAVFCLKKKKL